MRAVNLNKQRERSGMQGMFLDDVRVGQVFESTSVTVSTEDILAFARAFDPNPFHLDKAVAMRHGFPDIIAPGMYTLSLSMKLFFDLNLWNEAVLPSPGVNEVVWKRPVFPETRLFVRATVKEVIPSRTKPDLGIIKVHQETLDIAGETLFMHVEAMHRLRRRHEIEGATARIHGRGDAE
jgi:acyl dehydratase